MSRKRWCCLVFAALAAAVFAVGWVEAQQKKRPGGGRAGGFGFGGFGGGGGQTSPINLVLSAGVRKELEIEDDQQEDIEALRDDMNKEMEEVRRKVTAKYQDKLDKVLLPHQATRLKQISLQLRGLDALTDAEVAKKLGLSADQQKQIEAKRTEGQTKQRELFGGGGGGGGDFAERMEKVRKLREETDAAVLSVLSASQKSEFEKMKGKPIDRAQLFPAPKKKQPDTE